MNEQMLKKTICETMRALYAEKILTDLGGNISGRVQESSDEIWISPSGIKKNSVTPEMLVKIDLDFNVLESSRDDLRPSIESRIHTAIYRENEDFCAVIHSHAPYAMAYSLVGPFEIPHLTQELAMIVPELPFVPFYRSGSEELASGITEVIDECGAAVLQNHGLITAAETMEYCVILTRTVEEMLSTYLLARQLANGHPIHHLPD